MARSCKCAITGEIGTTDTFIKIGSKYMMLTSVRKMLISS